VNLKKGNEKMKSFNLFFFSPELGGTWKKTTVYAKNIKQAKKMVSNLYYVPVNRVFAQ